MSTPRPGPHLGLMTFKWRAHLISTLALGGGSASPHSPGVGLPSTSPSCPSECICVETRGYTQATNQLEPVRAGIGAHLPKCEEDWSSLCLEFRGVCWREG